MSCELQALAKQCTRQNQSWILNKCSAVQSLLIMPYILSTIAFALAVFTRGRPHFANMSIGCAASTLPPNSHYTPTGIARTHHLLTATAPINTLQNLLFQHSMMCLTSWHSPINFFYSWQYITLHRSTP